MQSRQDTWRQPGLIRGLEILSNNTQKHAQTEKATFIGEDPMNTINLQIDILAYLKNCSVFLNENKTFPL
jgi:hypothetical protein